MIPLIIVRVEKQIEEQIQKAEDTQHSSKYPGMSYEQGVIAMYEWLTGETDDLPLEDD